MSGPSKCLIERDVVLERHEGVVPGVAGWKRYRLPDLASQRPIMTVPDWVCDVVSPAEVAAIRYGRRISTFGWACRPTDLRPADRPREAFEEQRGRWLRLSAWTDGDTPRVTPFDAHRRGPAAVFLPVSP